MGSRTGGRGLLVALLVLLVSCQAFAQTAELVLGNPSNADDSDPNNYLVVRNEFILSYNRSRGAPNWVAWHLSKRDLGRFNREAGSFKVDELLPPESRVKESVYAGSGLELGHMCPSKDRSNRIPVNETTFVMSNVSPQVKRLNAGVWRALELHTQKKVGDRNEAYIYAGCYGERRRLKNQVSVPTRCFKIVLFLPNGSNDLERINENTEVVAVDMANTRQVRRPWRRNLTTIAEIEERTGFRFLSTLPENVRAALRLSRDNQ